MNPS
ncbi:BUD22 family protein, partial [Taphrina deformans PYCC 5710]|jgi:hypothetical protein